MEIPDEMVDVLRSAIRLIAPLLEVAKKVDDYMDVSEAAMLVGLKEKTIRNHGLSGDFDTIRVGGKIRIVRSSFMGWVDKSTKGSRNE